MAPLCWWHFCHLATWTRGLQRFREHSNRQLPNITFTIEWEKEGKLAFLDVQVTTSLEGLTTSVNRKPTHTDHYTSLSIHTTTREQSQVCKDVCKTGPTRFVTSPTRNQNCNTSNRSSKLMASLKAEWRGPWHINLLLSLHLDQHGINHQWSCVSLTSELSEKLERVCTPLRVRAVFKPMRTSVGELKKHIAEEKESVVYEVLAKTAARLSLERPGGPSTWDLSERKQAVKRGDPKNGIAVHVHESHHSI